VHFISERRERPESQPRQLSAGSQGGSRTYLRNGNGNGTHNTGGTKQRGRVSRFREECGDEISELRLDGGDPARVQPVRMDSVGLRGGQSHPIGEVDEEAQREMGRWGRRGRGSDYCTPGERRMVQGWIAACERAGCVGFRAFGAGRREADERFENGDGDDVEGVVNVRGGGNERRRGWPEWGAGWGAYRFMR
jgi:hypothetical protein